MLQGHLLSQGQHGSTGSARGRMHLQCSRDARALIIQRDWRVIASLGILLLPSVFVTFGTVAGGWEVGCNDPPSCTLPALLPAAPCPPSSLTFALVAKHPHHHHLHYKKKGILLPVFVSSRLSYVGHPSSLLYPPTSSVLLPRRRSPVHLLELEAAWYRAPHRLDAAPCMQVEQAMHLLAVQAAASHLGRALQCVAEQLLHL